MHPSERRLRKRTKRKGRVFDVQPTRDAASLSFPVRPLLTAMDVPTVKPVLKAKAWRRGTVLDQGAEGACVGHGVVAELLADPVRVKLDDADLGEDVPRDPQDLAFWLYRAAQRDDEWPGEDYSGTSVNAGMRVARSLGFLSGWRWIETYEDMRDCLMYVGPLVLAIPWHDGMYDAPGGIVTATGEQVGWHCILATGYDPSMTVTSDDRFAATSDPNTNGPQPREAIRLLNSWGPDWGENGAAWMDAAELWNLIAYNDGEVVAPIGRDLNRLVSGA